MTTPTQIGSGFDSVLLAAQTGAGWALERLWLSLAPTVTGYLASQGVKDAEDVTSDVFIAVFRNINSFSGTEAGFRSWVFTIAHRRVQDVRRQSARRSPAERFEPHRHEQPAAEGPEQQVLRRLGTESVAQLCARLVPDQRDALLLRLVAGMTIDEVAEALGKSRGATKALQRRGLLAIQKILQSEGVPI